MDFMKILTLISGLALFLYGMSTLSDGLIYVSGGKLERLLEKMTKNKTMAVLLGAFVTMMIQSSSATTVMVVGFVNSGIMKLTQAVGVIMGANIGTTTTSWILALSGIENSNPLLSFLKPTSILSVIAVVGVFFLMTGKNGTKKKMMGVALLGFVVLMVGMQTMIGAVSSIKESDQVANLLKVASNPILAMLIGILITAFIQSSAASIGLLQAFSMTGLINFGLAIPMIMGQNIGTCLTAIHSSRGASNNGKRAAYIHLYFNLIGTAIFAVIFYAWNYLLPFSFMGKVINPMNIAILHTVFNLSSAIILFPFTNLLVKLACKTIHDEDEKDIEEEIVLTRLDDRFLDSPSYAARLSKKAVNEMARITQDAIYSAIELTKEYSEETASKISKLEQKTDHFDDTLEKYLVKLSSRDLNEKDNKRLSLILHAITDLERIADHAVIISMTMEKMKNQKVYLSQDAKLDLDYLCGMVHDILETTVSGFVTEDFDKSESVELIDEMISRHVFQMKERHIDRLKTGSCSLETGVLFEDVMNSLERVSARCTNIAYSVMSTQTII